MYPISAARLWVVVVTAEKMGASASKELDFVSLRGGEKPRQFSCLVDPSFVAKKDALFYGERLLDSSQLDAAEFILP